MAIQVEEFGYRQDTLGNDRPLRKGVRLSQLLETSKGDAPLVEMPTNPNGYYKRTEA